MRHRLAAGGLRLAALSRAIRPQVARRTSRAAGRRPQAGCAVAAVALFAVLAAAPRISRQPPASLSPALAYRIIDLPSGRVVASAHDDLLRVPVLPGSILKIATLMAALETGVIQPTTRIACPRHLDIDGHRLDCSHPDLGRPLGPAEALAHSCNGYFATVARRLRREALDRALVGLGLPPSSASATVVSSALGLDGARLSPEQVLQAFVRLTTSDRGPTRASVRQVVIDGLRGAAEFGTAAAFRESGLTALAKTGTAPMPGGGYEGLLVAVIPAEHPSRAIVVMAPGAAGMDAARFAVERLAAADAKAPAGSRVPASPRKGGVDGPQVRVGVAGRSGGYDVVTLSLEEYVSRVVSAEAAPSSGAEALKALAVVARTFALRNASRHAREGFDLCDLTHCQVMGIATKASDAAARATEGRVLFYEDRLADVYYTASCGGRSERPSGAWPGSVDPPYLRVRAEPECEGRDRWQSEVTAADLQRAFVAAGRRGELIRDLRVIGRTGSGRVAAVRIDGILPPEITGGEMRAAVGRTLGWQVLKSTLFEVERTASGYRFAGSGRGHGVGLCEAGSSRMAAAGQPARAILERYFPGTDVGPAGAGAAGAGAGLEARSPAPRIEVVLPVTEERERPRVEEVGAAALREFSARLGIAAPDGIRVVAHATVEAYMRASGQPWWTVGRTQGLRIDLAPLAPLRERGLLESTLRHELAHAMTAGRLKGRPIWVQEGVAMDLAGAPRFPQPPGEPAGRATGQTCPSDAEWRALRSADELQRAYRRAAGCYAAQRAKGLRWDEVR